MPKEQLQPRQPVRNNNSLVILTKRIHPRAQNIHCVCILGTTATIGSTSYGVTQASSSVTTGASGGTSGYTVSTTVVTAQSGQPTPSSTPGTSQTTSSGTPGTGQTTTSGTAGTGQTTASGTPGTGQTTTSGTPGTGQTITSGTPGTTTTGKYCDEMEYIDTLIATDSVKTTPKDIPNKGDLITKGVDFTDNKPSFILDLPKGGAIVRDIQLPSKNVQEIEVTFTTKSGKVTTPIRGSPTSLPTDKFPTEKVVEIVIQVTKTNNYQAPTDVTLSVIACAEGTVTTTPTGKS